MYNTYANFKNTITKTYLGDIDSNIALAKVKKYNSAIEASLFSDNVDLTIYNNLKEKFKNIAVNCAKAIGANICGVDMMIKDFKDENSEYGIIELNFNPAIHIHCFPYIGKERNIAKEVLKLLELI